MIIYSIYFLTGLLICLFVLSQILLFISYIFRKQNFDFEPNFQPKITIQLPIYNEKYVVERLLKAISELDYPDFEVQFLDDSTDGSEVQNQDWVGQYRQLGLDINFYHRTDRSQYKAGALASGLKIAKGDFICIFDSDFVPEKDWLKNTIGYMKSPKVGVVQTRWAHINKDYNLLTKIQALVLDHHFTIEQSGRNLGGNYINFNGTAGIWRKQTILDAGNWSGDTLTEDLDLSYRAQNNNWEFRFIESQGTPAELPMVMSSVRSQQTRWNKGGAENFRKHISGIWNNPNLAFSVKYQATAHLLNSSAFLWSFILSLSTFFILLIPAEHYLFHLPFKLLKFVFVYFILSLSFTHYRLYNTNWLGFFVNLFFFFPIILGLGLHNTLAVLEGYLGIKTAFIRTPKFATGDWKTNIYRKKQISIVQFAELCLAIMFGFGVYLAITTWRLDFLVYHLTLCLGYAYVSIKSFFE